MPVKNENLHSGSSARSPNEPSEVRSGNAPYNKIFYSTKWRNDGSSIMHLIKRHFLTEPVWVKT